jgi:anti-anti-sigma factor
MPMQPKLLSDEHAMLDEKAVVRVACEGQISHDEFDAAKDPMRQLLGPLIFSRKVLLNLEKTTYINSSGISWLIICHKHFVQAKGQLILHTIPPLIFQVMQMVRLPVVVPVAADEAAALALAQGEKT